MKGFTYYANQVKEFKFVTRFATGTGIGLFHSLKAFSNLEVLDFDKVESQALLLHIAKGLREKKELKRCKIQMPEQIVSLPCHQLLLAQLQKLDLSEVVPEPKMFWNVLKSRRPRRFVLASN